jgi:hypothetical protein
MIATILATSLSIGTPAFPQEDNQTVSWLIVQTSSGFTSDGDSLTVPYERDIFSFTSRPDRMHAHLNAHELAALWRMGGHDFTETPPNAVLTWVANDEIHEAEIELAAISVDDMGRSITYEITFEAGDQIPSEGGYASLFIEGFFDLTADTRHCFSAYGFIC